MKAQTGKPMPVQSHRRAILAQAGAGQDEDEWVGCQQAGENGGNKAQGGRQTRSGGRNDFMQRAAG